MQPHRLFRQVPLAPHQLVADITPQHDLFVLAHMGVPQVDAAKWTLSVDGLVRQPQTFTIADIRSFPKREVEAFHQCAGFPKNPELPTRRIGNVVWGGAELKSFLASDGLLPQARYLWSYGLDYGDYDGLHAQAYLKDLPLERLARGNVLLAYEINGEPLDPLHGYPLRLVVPGFYGTNSVKWLSHLTLADRRADGVFTTQLYNDPVPGGGTRPVWQVAPESVIVSPAPDTEIGGAPVEIWGRAWADGGVASVEVSTDGGESWHDAALTEQNESAWQTFRLMWEPRQHGAAVLMSRAADRSGATQPATGWRNAIHAVRVVVAAR